MLGQTRDTLQKKQSLNSHFQVVYQAQEISLEKSQQKILDKISFTVYEGDFFFLVGESGSGKTSLLNILADQEKITSGFIHHSFSGHCIYVRENDSFFSSLSCYDNLLVSYDPKIYTSKEEFKKIVDDISELLGCHHQLDLNIEKANQGLRQKISFMRGILAKPTVLLLDEPTSNLDWASAQKIIEILNYYNKQSKVTIVWATYNNQLPRVANAKALYLKNGRVLKKASV